MCQHLPVKTPCCNLFAAIEPVGDDYASKPPAIQTMGMNIPADSKSLAIVHAMIARPPRSGQKLRRSCGRS